jgi:small subunit ribosomal protein S4
MKTGPKFKIAKRLGAPIYEKTQGQKFALSEARTGKTRKRFSKPSDYKRQLLEKQKMRLTYGLSERQFRSYVDLAMEKSQTPIEHLFCRLEYRLDNVVYRAGLAKTRRLARQIVTHGHITLNGRKMNVPSHKVKIGDIVSVREGSRSSALFTDLAERHEATAVPNWVEFDLKNLSVKVSGTPKFQPTEAYFDPEQVLEYYSR